MNALTVPKWVKKHDFEPNEQDLHAIRNNIKGGINTKIDEIRQKLQQFKVENPVVSIVIPAYNEERDLLKTLSSLAELQPNYPTELIVSNNNSTDLTQIILERCGVRTVFAKNQGISYARQAGLEAARGKYILSADADTIYPTDYGNAFIKTLEDPAVACVYGRYSFIPSQGGRVGLAIHEMCAEFMFDRRKSSNEAANVMGFTFAYRKADGLQIGGFKHDLNRKVTERSEDGWLALELSKLGRIQLVKTKNRVWTSDRRLLDDGTLLQAFINRAKKYAGRFWRFGQHQPA